MTYTRRTRLAAAVAGAVMLTATAGCGGDGDGDGGDKAKSSESSSDFADKSVDEIQKAALKDMGALDSVRMAGDITNDGGEMSLDLQLNTDGDCSGTIAMDGAEAEIIGVGTDSYLKGTKEFWSLSMGGGNDEQTAAIVQMIGDKWAKVPDGGFTEVCDLDAFLDNLEDGDESDSDDKGEVVGETDVDGTPAVEIKSEEDGETTTVWVGSEENKHYILKMAVTGGDEPGEFTFSEFDEPIDVEAPADDQVVDLANMGG